MRTLESLAVSRRAAGRLVGLPASLGVHAAVVTLVVTVPALLPPELPAAGGPIPDVVVWTPPAPPPVVTVAPPRASRAPIRRSSGPRVGGGPTRGVSTEVPVGLPAPGNDPGPPPDHFVIGGGCDDCAGVGTPGLPPGTGLPGADQPGPPTVVRSGWDVTPPRKVRHVAPAYPDLAQRAGLEGEVVLECVIDPLGRIAEARVVRGHPLFDAAALDAVRQWAYTPTRVGGVPVSVQMTVTVGFHLRR